MADCSVEGCEKTISARGLCSAHYHRLVRHGNPLGGPRKPYNRPWEERFRDRVTKIPGGCWLFDGSRKQDGYATFEISASQSGTGQRRTLLAHRVAWEIEYGTPPVGELDHSCYLRTCVKLDHLEIVGRHENIRRGTEQRRRERAAFRILTELHPELVADL